MLRKEADAILSLRLDLDIELFKTLKPDFYSQYKSARTVNDAKGRFRASLPKIRIG